MIDAVNNPVVGYMGDARPLPPREGKEFDSAAVRFANSPLAQLPRVENPLALHGDEAPALAVLREKPEHRMIVYLKLQGKSNREVASITGYSPTHVNTICRQPWFRDLFTTLAHDIGRDSVDSFLQGEVLPCLETLRDIRDNPAAPANARSLAANSLLDRYLGKPVQRVETKNSTTISHAADEAARLDAEIADLQKQLASRGLASPN